MQLTEFVSFVLKGKNLNSILNYYLSNSWKLCFQWICYCCGIFV